MESGSAVEITSLEEVQKRITRGWPSGKLSLEAPGWTRGARDVLRGPADGAIRSETAENCAPLHIIDRIHQISYTENAAPCMGGQPQIPWGWGGLPLLLKACRGSWRR